MDFCRSLSWPQYINDLEDEIALCRKFLDDITLRGVASTLKDRIINSEIILI